MTEINAVVPTWFLWMITACMGLYLLNFVLDIVLAALNFLIKLENRKINAETKKILGKFIKS